MAKNILIKDNSIHSYGLQDVSFITYSIKFWYACVDFKFAGKLHTTDNSCHVIIDEYCIYLWLEDWVHALYNPDSVAWAKPIFQTLIENEWQKQPMNLNWRKKHWRTQ
jgi:hypothetical protein